MKLILTNLLTCLVVIVFAQKPVDSKTNEIVFRDVSVITMLDKKIGKPQWVVVKDGRITQIGGAKEVEYGRLAIVINGKGKYLMPGLAEMHAHVPPIDNIEPMKEVLLLFASQGVTTIRGMLGHPRHLELRSKINSGEILGPRFITSGPSFNGNSVKSPEEGAAMVRAQKEAGYDFLKLHPGLSVEKFAAIAQAAKDNAIAYSGHVSFDVGVWRAIAAGYATIDHMDGFIESLVPGIENIGEQQAGPFASFVGIKADSSRIPGLMKGLRDRNIWVVPTQSLAERWFSPIETEVLRSEPEMKYMSANALTQWVNSKNNFMNQPKYKAEEINQWIQLRRKLILECQRNGVGLLLGSDAPQVFDVPGFSIHHELKYMVTAGLTPYEALQSGTSNVGKFMNDENIGVIKIGAYADLILLNGNPLTDINQTKNIEGVMLGGRWLSRAWLDATLKSLEK